MFFKEDFIYPCIIFNIFFFLNFSIITFLLLKKHFLLLSMLKKVVLLKMSVEKNLTNL